jgi:glycosyltransferase involved in cell wall biosynthesis
LNAGLRIAAAVRRLRPDLVWLNLGASVFGRNPLANLCGFLSPALCRGLGTRVVVTLHEIVEQADLPGLGAPGGRFALLGARLLTRLGLRSDVVCFTLRRQVEWIACARPAARLAHIPHGVFHPPQILPERAGQDLLIFTHHAPFKGLELLLEAYQALRFTLPGLRLWVAGADHPRYPGYLEHVRDQYAHLPGVTWLGQVPEAGLRDLFTRANVVVLPYKATTGTSSVLYRAAGAVVCSDLPELCCAVEEAGLQAEFFPSQDAQGLAQALRRVLCDAKRRRGQVEANIQAVSRYSLESTGQAYVRAFGMAFAGSESSHSPFVIRKPGEIL